jgi:hypothetical protein
MQLTAESGFHACRRCGRHPEIFVIPNEIDPDDDCYYVKCDCAAETVKSIEVFEACRQWNNAVWWDSTRSRRVLAWFVFPFALVWYLVTVR